MSEQDISNESIRGTCHVFIAYSHDSPEHWHRVLPWLSASARTASMPSLINTGPVAIDNL
jgi:hypothetical protein